MPTDMPTLNAVTSLIHAPYSYFQTLLRESPYDYETIVQYMEDLVDTLDDL